jgi:hypothetical protein
VAIELQLLIRCHGIEGDVLVGNLDLTRSEYYGVFHWAITSFHYPEPFL